MDIFDFRIRRVHLPPAASTHDLHPVQHSSAATDSRSRSFKVSWRLPGHKRRILSPPPQAWKISRLPAGSVNRSASPWKEIHGHVQLRRRSTIGFHRPSSSAPVRAGGALRLTRGSADVSRDLAGNAAEHLGAQAACRANAAASARAAAPATSTGAARRRQSSAPPRTGSARPSRPALRRPAQGDRAAHAVAHQEHRPARREFQRLGPQDYRRQAGSRRSARRMSARPASGRDRARSSVTTPMPCAQARSASQA
jgi:hypothetical protein